MSAVKKLNIVDIENGLEELAKQNFSPVEYGKELVALFAPTATTKRLGTTKANTSDFENGILWREKLHYVPCKAGELNEVIEKAKASDQTLKAKVRLVVVNDGSHILVFDRKYNELTDCTIETVKDEPQLFLPLTGQEGFRREAENEVDIKATGKLAKLYDALIEKNPDWLLDDKRHVLNHFITQIIFCLFAEDTGIFPKDIFTKTLKNRAGSNGENATEVITGIYSVLDLNDAQRAETSAWQNEFPYVNGGLFSGATLIPDFTPKAYRYLLEASSLDWKHINPDILGSSIQAIVDPTMRGNLGMHYTSVPNILKTLEPLFLNELRDELLNARHSRKLINLFLARLSKIVVFDPACGSGNFLVIAYRELRKLELQAMDALKDIQGGASMSFGFGSVISLSNFYGIEYADFAAETAKLALWIAEYQQNSRFIAAFKSDIPALPLKDSGCIACNNALRVDWDEFCKFEEDREIYTVSNPPYLGAREMKQVQKEDMSIVFEGYIKKYNNLDYVSAWFFKATKFSENRRRQFAFVSTNTITQGSHIGNLWPSILDTNMEIHFAYRSFLWSNSAAKNAAVICVIVGLRNQNNAPKIIIDNGTVEVAENINPYLKCTANCFVVESPHTLNLLPQMTFGNMPNDGGHLLLNSEDRKDMLEQFPDTKPFVRKFFGSSDFINNKSRFCIWITQETLDEAVKVSPLSERISLCKEYREKSSRAATKKLAGFPYRFGEVRQVESKNVLIIPRHSSINRDYLPIGYLTNDEIIGDSCNAVFNSKLGVFSLLISRMHIIWIDTVCGKIKNDFRYSNTLGYNTFPVPKLTDTQWQLLEVTGRNIILARENHYPKSMSEIYNKHAMPDDLRNAHIENDKLLESFYQDTPFENDEDRLAHLFARYVEMTKGVDQ